MNNIPDIKIGIVAVSRDCFPAPLAVNRRKAVVEAYMKKYGGECIYECPITIVESEIDMVNALEDVRRNGCNALCVYLGNFGPEIAETLLAKHFDGPVMFSAAAEESQDTLGIQGCGDTYCGMLNASYNLALRNVKAWIPENPTRDAEGVAENIHDFVPIARVVYGLEHLKIITFEPRPQNFLACNAPIRQLYNLNIEIEEESELDLFESYEKHYCAEKYDLDAETVKRQNARISEIRADMMKELCINSPSEKQSAMLDKFAAYEATLLDLNNSVLRDMYEESIRGKFPRSSLSPMSPNISLSQNTPFYILSDMLELSRQGDTMRDTLCIKPEDITFYRVQSTADAKLRAYIAQGEVLPVATRSFGSIGVFAIKEMGRFYRYELIGNNYPHHGEVMFGHHARALYEALKHIEIDQKV